MNVVAKPVGGNLRVFPQAQLTKRCSRQGNIAQSSHQQVSGICALLGSRPGPDKKHLRPYSPNLLRSQDVSRVVRCAARNGPLECFGRGGENGEYIKAIVEHVFNPEGEVYLLNLKILDGSDMILPVYIGKTEYVALKMIIKNERHVRPQTYEFMKSSLESVGYRVDKVAVSQRQGNTYYATVYYETTIDNITGSMSSHKIEVDARPSDAINLALRCQAPIYVNREVISSSAVRPEQAFLPVNSSDNVLRQPLNIVSQFQENISKRHGCTLELRASLALAVQEGRITDAKNITDTLAKVVGCESAVLILSLEQAVAEERYKDAAKIRAQLDKLDLEADLAELNNLTSQESE